MDIQLEQLYGIWRNEKNNVIMDLNVRRYNEHSHKGFSLFTIYRRNQDDSKIIYEWQGVPEIINYSNQISDINILDIQQTEDNPIYQNLKIWEYTNKKMILEFGDGSKKEFVKLDNIFN
jgi:hypothetical protein